MAVPLVKYVIIIQYKASIFDQKSAVLPGESGLFMSIESIRDNKAEIPVKGCVDFAIINKGTAKAFLFDGAIEILPGQTWFPQKSSPLPLINQPVITFEGDFQQSRNSADLLTPPPTA